MAGGEAGFGVELYALETVAKDHLPTVAAVYENAIAKCQAARAALDGMSSVPEQFLGSGGSVSNAYDELHSAVVGVLESTRISLDETAEALHESVVLYAQTDQAAANKLHEMLQERGEPHPELTS